MADATDKEIGARIKRVRAALGISQMRLAESVGVSFQQVQKYESGANKVSVGKLKKIAGALRVPLGFLIGIEARGQESEIREQEPGSRGQAAEGGEEQRRMSFDDLTGEEIQLLVRFRATANEDIRKGVLLILQGAGQEAIVNGQ